MAPKKLRLIHGYKPHDAVVLGIDPAKKSGWAIFVRGQMMRSGLARDATERFDVLQQAEAFAEDEALPLVVVAESWSPGGWKSFAAVAGAHEAWGRWAEQLELMALTCIVRVLVNTWRRDLYGKGSTRMSRKEAKLMAKQRVRGTYGIQVSDDEAEAILIAEWGCRAGEVRVALAA